MPIPAITSLKGADKISSSKYDALVLVAPSSFAAAKDLPLPSSTFEELAKVDKKFGTEVSLLAHSQACGGRIVVSPISSLDNDVDDVRQISDAAKKGILRAKAAGAVRPLLVLSGVADHSNPDYSHAVQVALLASLEASYERLQARETLGEDATETVKEIGFLVPSAFSDDDAKHTIDIVTGIEAGRRLARDIGGGDPERMTPFRSAKFIQEAFNSHKSIKVNVIDNEEQIKKDYPLLFSVARASTQVERHKPCVVHLEYTSDAAAEETLLISGKGVTYDTGGADVKFDGHMAGMSRDKCGAAAAAGLVLTAALLKPKGVRIIAELGFVRNSIGPDSYVADEIITSHAGARVMVGNSDAEGRMVLSDCLSHLRKQALEEKVPQPRFMTIATLTGHVIRAYGSYTAVVDNGPAQQQGISSTLQRQGHLWADPIEVSTLRREDYNIIASKNNAYDILQCNNAASSATPRGHQFPAAFLLRASGLDKHGKNSNVPLCYTHIDVAGSAVENLEYQFGKPTAAPLVALTARYLLPRLAHAVKGFAK